MPQQAMHQQQGRARARVEIAPTRSINGDRDVFNRVLLRMIATGGEIHRVAGCSGQLFWDCVLLSSYIASVASRGRRQNSSLLF